MVQLNQDQAERLYDAADVTYYVIAGEGTAKMNGRDSTLVAGSFVSVSRGTPHSLARRGRRPLIMLTTVSGTPCEEARECPGVYASSRTNGMTGSGLRNPGMAAVFSLVIPGVGQIYNGDSSAASSG